MVTIVPKTSTSLTGLVVIKPDNFDPAKTYKAILFAHGIGERGDGSALPVKDFLENQTNLPKAIAAAGTHILIAPQLVGSVAWSTNYGDFAYDYAIKNFKIDPKIYLTGVSWGGQLIWLWGGNNPTKIAAILAVCACTTSARFDQIKCPVEAWHAKDDGMVSYAEGNVAINSINAYNPPVKAVMNSYDTGNHYIWTRVYAEPKALGLLGLPTTVPVSTTTTTTTSTPSTTLKADASATLTSVLGTTATLDGSKSTGYQSSGGWVFLDWSLVSFPPGASWDVFPNFNKHGEKIQVQNLKPGAYQFELKAQNGTNVSKDVVTINVVEASTTTKTEFISFTDNGKKYTVFTDKTWSAV